MSDWTHSSPIDGSFSKYALSYAPDDPDWEARQEITVRCALCPDWSEPTTRAEMRRVYDAHKETQHA